MLTRRSALLGGGALVVAGGAAVLTEGPRLRRVLHLEPESPHHVPSGPVGELVSGSFFSAAMKTTTGWSIAYPHGTATGSRLPVLVTLHGRSGTHRSAFSDTHLDRFLSAAVRSGVAPFAIASVDGGNHSYYHPRADGTDPQRMIVDELLPVLAARGLRTDRIALGGISMGGYGALLLAERLGPSRVAVVAVDSPAVWQRWQDSAQGAFDGPQDFSAHDVIEASATLRGLPVRVTCGTSDPFLPGVRELLRKLPSAERELGPGAHNSAWWLHTAPAQLAFVGRHLTP